MIILPVYLILLSIFRLQPFIHQHFQKICGCVILFFIIDDLFYDFFCNLFYCCFSIQNKCAAFFYGKGDLGKFFFIFFSITGASVIFSNIDK